MKQAVPEAAALAPADARPVRGFPGGIDELGSAAAGPAGEVTSGVAGPASSVWERSWQAWCTAGIAWQRPADWAKDTVESHTEPIPVVTAGPEPPGLTVPQAPAAGPGTPAPQAPASGARPANGDARDPRPPAAASHLLPRRRPSRRAGLLAAVVSLAVALAAVAATEVSRQAMAARHTSLALVTPFRPARFTSAGVAASSGLPSSALPPSLTALAVAGQTAVAAGAAPAAGALVAARSAGLPARLPLIMDSTDGGRTWQRAVMHEIPGSVSGSVPVLAAGGHGRWLALGRRYAWTSTDGMVWRESTGISPETSGDQVQSLVRTAGGFLAAGVNVTGQGHRTRYRPVVWRSADGRHWRRDSDAKTGLPVGDSSVLALPWAASHLGTILLGGKVARMAAHGRPAAGTVREAAWRSTDGGLRWVRVSVPASHGATRRLAGIVASGAGFVAVRPGHTGAGIPDAMSYVSRDGVAWRFGGRITAPRHFALRVTAVAGGLDGAVVGGTTGQRPAAFVSPRGFVWQRAAGLAVPAGSTLTGLAAAPAGQAMAAVITPGGQPSLLLAGKRARVVGRRVLAGAAANVVVNGLARAGQEQVAAGGVAGLPAIWWRRGNGPWQRAAVPAQPAPAQPAPAQPAPAQPGAAGQQRAGRFTGVAHGRGGWLAVGSSVGTGPAQLAVMTSRDGRTWQSQPGSAQFTAPGTAAKVTAVAAWRSGFVAVGSADGHPAVWTNPGGGHWQLTNLPPPAGVAHAGLTAVAGAGQRLAAFGTAATRAGPKPFQALSSDGGHTWRESALPVPGGFASVTAAVTADGGFVVAGTASAVTAAESGAAAYRNRVLVWWSPDGLSWHTAAIPGGHGSRPGATPGPGEITALTAWHGRLTGFGYAPTPFAAQLPIAWHARLRQR